MAGFFKDLTHPEKIELKGTRHLPIYQYTSPKFFQLMINRTIMSASKYGPMNKVFPHVRDAMDFLGPCIEAYQKTGNKEHLVDAANFLMIEFMYPSHPNAHWEATDAEGSLFNDYNYNA